MPSQGTEEEPRGISEKESEDGGRQEESEDGDRKEELDDGDRKDETVLSEDQASPRCVLEIPSPSSDSDRSRSSSCSSLTTTEKLTTQRGGGSGSLGESHRGHGLLQWRSVVDALRKKSAKKFLTSPVKRSDGVSVGGSTWKAKKKLARIRSADDAIDCCILPASKPAWRSFDFAELASATDNFSAENLIGRGGHAEVYKGRLADGQLVAVKRLIKRGNEAEEIRTADFLSELGIIAHIDHPNAARLLGFGVDGGLHLVLQFSPHGSLASALHGSTDSLEWRIRFKVAAGVAEGLKYLHHGCQRRIIHRDIKASNILLTQDYDPEISDFGLAKWLPEKWAQHVVFPIEGTIGYLAPEYFMHGIVDEKIDVFAFGVLLLEIITGRRAVDSTRQSLVMWARPLLDSNDIKELADPRLGDAYDVGEMKRATMTASMCVHYVSTMRPDMNKVVQMLKGEDGVQEYWKHRSVSGRALLLDACDLEHYTCTAYLKDLNRHMQLISE